MSIDEGNVMGDMTPADRYAMVGERLKGQRALWASSHPARAIFRSTQGYIIRWRDGATMRYLSISPDGEVQDMGGYTADGGDIEVAISSFTAAGMREMAQKVINWPRGRH
jgi:hypothetical protein